MKKLILFIMLWGICVSAEDSGYLDLKPGKIMSRKTEGKFGIGYHISVPGTYKDGSKPPLLITFSPGGGGKGIMNSFRSSAEKAGWIVVGCDKLKNGMKSEESNPIEDELLDEILVKIPHSRLYFGGMSGGAMRSFSLTGRRSDPVDGIFSCGGWMGGSDHWKGNFPKGMYVGWINGDKDDAANSWIERDTAFLKKFSTTFKRFSFPGGHQMAPPDTLDKVFTWIEEPRNQAKVEKLETLYKSKKYGEAYALAKQYSIQEPDHAPQSKKSKELVVSLEQLGKQQGEKLLASKSPKISSVIAFIDVWGKKDPITEKAREYVNERGIKSAEEVLAQEPLSQKSLKKYLMIWKDYPCAEPVKKEFNTMGEKVLVKLKAKNSKQATLRSFAKFWEGMPCTTEVVNELNIEGEKELEKLLSKSKPSPSLLMRFSKSWEGYPVNKKAMEVLNRMAEDELKEIQKVEKVSSKKSKLYSFSRKYKGTDAADRATVMLAELKKK